MDNTEKLLRAFIKAQGYEVEETKEYIDDGIDHWPNRGEPNICVIDYKVTKNPKRSTVIMEVNSPEWSAICYYVLEHKDEIENSINDYYILKPVLDFFSRNCKELTSEDIIHSFGESIL